MTTRRLQKLAGLYGRALDRHMRSTPGSITRRCADKTLDRIVATARAHNVESQLCDLLGK